MADLANGTGFLAARLAGATAGAAMSLIYLFPRSRREAASRFFTGLACGVIFAAPAGLWLSRQLELTGEMSRVELLLMGATAASLTAWWGLGILARLATRLMAARTSDGETVHLAKDENHD